MRRMYSEKQVVDVVNKSIESGEIAVGSKLYLTQVQWGQMFPQQTLKCITNMKLEKTRDGFKSLFTILSTKIELPSYMCFISQNNYYNNKIFIGYIARNYGSSSPYETKLYTQYLNLETNAVEETEIYDTATNYGYFSLSQTQI